jgi:hypothetical protein
MRSLHFHHPNSSQPQGPPPAQLTEDWTRAIPVAFPLEIQLAHLALLGDEIPF